MTYIITEFENTTYGGCFIVYRTDDLVKWLDKVQELKAQYHLKKTRCAFWQHTRIDGSGYTFFSFARHPLKRPDDRQKGTSDPASRISTIEGAMPADGRAAVGPSDGTGRQAWNGARATALKGLVIR